MLSTAATEPDFADSRLNLLACLALYQHRQDQAVGIGWTSSRVRGLLWYYALLQEKQATGYLTAAYLNGIIQEGAKEIKRLVERAETVEDKRAILEQAQIIQQKVEEAKAELDKINREVYSRSESIETN